MTPSTIENTEAVNPDGELRQGLFAAQAARIVELQAEIASRQEEIDNLKSLILDSHPVGTYQAGNLKVQVKPGARRINAGTFEKAYPATKYPGAYQLKPRPLSQLEKLLTSDAVADYAMSGKPMVVVSSARNCPAWASPRSWKAPSPTTTCTTRTATS